MNRSSTRSQIAVRAASLALAAVLLAPGVIHADALPLYIGDPTANEKIASGIFLSLGEGNVKRSLSLAAEKRWGNDYMHARYYSPNLGRFVSVDPVGGTLGSSQSWNRYSYVLNNPIAFVDPYGEEWFNFNDEWVFLEDIDELSQTVVNDDGSSFETTIQGEESLVTFDGGKVTLFGADGSTQSFPARAGHLDSNLNTQPDLQDVSNVGPIPEGRWSFNPQEIQHYQSPSGFEKWYQELGGTAWPGGESSWGSQRAWLVPECYTGPRDNFTIHGGDTFGSRGCIDLARYGSAFFNAVDKSLIYMPVFVNYGN